MASQTDGPPTIIRRGIKSFVRINIGEILPFNRGARQGKVCETRKLFITYCCLWGGGGRSDNMSKVDVELAAPHGKPSDSVGRNSRREG